MLTDILHIFLYDIHLIHNLTSSKITKLNKIQHQLQNKYTSEKQTLTTPNIPRLPQNTATVSENLKDLKKTHS